MDDKAAKEYFDGISSYSDIQNLVKTRAREGLYLDFKTYEKAKNNVKENLSKSASGFAHQSGGVIIWGIEAKQSKDGDFAQKLKPIDELSVFLSLLDNLSQYTVEPKLKIIHEPIYELDDHAKNKGFIKSFFPSSEDIHRACFAEYNFYQRFGGSHFPISSKEDLIRLINRNKETKLNLKIASSIKSFSTNKEGEVTSGLKKVTFSLKNEGNEVAEFPSFLIEATLPIPSLHDANGGTEFSPGSFINMPGIHGKYFIPNVGFVIHPTQEILIGSANFKEFNTEIKFTYKCFAKNMNAIEGEITV